MPEATALNIVNKDMRFRKVTLKAPSDHHYLLMAAEVDRAVLPFFLFFSKKKKRLIKQCKQFCDNILPQNEIVSAHVFKAILIPPGRGKFISLRKERVRIARFDVVILIETDSRQAMDALINTDDYRALDGAFKMIAASSYIITATNVKRIDTVDHNRQGVFLFNYFFGDSLQQNLDVWEYTAGWFQQETGLDNSTVLLPPDQSAYTIINHCRWDKLTDIFPSLLFKKSFHSYVLDNFYANNVAAMPVLYKLA